MRDLGDCLPGGRVDDDAVTMGSLVVLLPNPCDAARRNSVRLKLYFVGRAAPRIAGLITTDGGRRRAPQSCSNWSSCESVSASTGTEVTVRDRTHTAHA